jgi:y4mF family transcriptional regulator
MRILSPLDLGQLVRSRRRALDWTQGKLAKRIGVGRPWLGELERGKNAAPLRLVLKTLSALGLTLAVPDEPPSLLPPGPAPRRPDLSGSPQVETDPVGRPRSTEQFEAAAPKRPRAYDGQTTAAPGNANHPAFVAYQVADLEAEGFVPNPALFYDKEYRHILRRMAAHVVAVEAPIFEDLLARRIARIHGFDRAARRIRTIIAGVVDAKFKRTIEKGRKIIWAEAANTHEMPPFRSAPLDVRNHLDIPLAELASLARPFLAQGATPDETASLMGRELRLARMVATTRQRFEKAARLALSHAPAT